MAHVVIMPKLGLSQEEGQLVKWLKKVGDPVKKGEVFYEIHTDKMVMEMEAVNNGFVLKIMLEEGEFAPVFTPIAVIGEANENPDEALKNYTLPGTPTNTPEADAKSAAVAKQDEKPATEKAATDSLKELKLSPKAKKYVKDEEIDPLTLAGIVGTGFQGCVVPEDIRLFLASKTVPTNNEKKATFLAQNVAEKMGVSLSDVTGSGERGKVLKTDVLAAASETCAKACEGDAGAKILSTSPYKGMRKIIGERLTQSKLEAPHVYFTDSIDTVGLTKIRCELNARSEVKIAFSDLMVFAVGKALQKYPGVNVSLRDEQIICYKSLNIGIAVAGAMGLIVPVVKNVQEKSLADIVQKSRELVQKAMDGRLPTEDYSDGTFTITNLGMFGIENFVPIINPPEAAILGVSSIRKKAVVVTDEKGEDEIVVRSMMNIMLSVDHRLIDGLLAAQFLAYLKQLLENPVLMLM